ncbi:MAG: STAS domain-containing protein [Candidatus Acidiferrales bacterium]|jgi:anti-sigma B factor antagonist
MSLTGTAPSPDLKIEVEKKPEETLVHCTGRITSSTSEMLKSSVRPLISEAKRVVLDLTNVNYLDSSGLGMIVGFWVSAKREKCQLKIVNANKRIIDLFLMSNLAPILEGHQEFLGITPD